jgi:hypothetical protein
MLNQKGDQIHLAPAHRQAFLFFVKTIIFDNKPANEQLHGWHHCIKQLITLIVLDQACCMSYQGPIGIFPDVK